MNARIDRPAWKSRLAWPDHPGLHRPAGLSKCVPHTDIVILHTRGNGLSAGREALAQDHAGGMPACDA